jgi:hypothetical protein
MERGQAGRGTALPKHTIYCMALAGVLLTPLPAKATDPPLSSVNDIRVPLIEWDLLAIVDAQPGAMVVDTQGHDQEPCLVCDTSAGAPAGIQVRTGPVAHERRGPVGERNVTTNQVRRGR